VIDQLPADLHAEKTILGAIMQDNAVLYEVTQILEPSDFSLESHQRIYQRMIEMSEDGHAIDIVTLPERLQRTREIHSVGGFAYLADLDAGLPSRPAIGNYLRILKDKSLARQMMKIAEAATIAAAEGRESALDVFHQTLEDLEAAASSVHSQAKPVQEILVDSVAKFEARMNRTDKGLLGCSLFTPAIDDATGGIQDGELCLLAARPGQGKTEAAIQSALRNARRGLRVHIQSLEMGRQPLMERFWRLMARVPVASMRDPRCLTPDQRKSIREAQEEMCDLPIQIDDTHELKVTEFRSRAVLAAKRWKADLIVVDYGQLLIVPKAKNAVEAAPKQAETLRHIARDYCKTLALVQLRRTPPNDLNRYPDIEDIFGASQWEQAAQIILMLHRTRDNKLYTGEDFCFVGKMREMQQISSLGIKAEKWGQFNDRYDEQKPQWWSER
jgi:replicative DNA helicase